MWKSVTDADIYIAYREILIDIVKAKKKRANTLHQSSMTVNRLILTETIRRKAIFLIL